MDYNGLFLLSDYCNNPENWRNLDKGKKVKLMDAFFCCLSIHHFMSQWPHGIYSESVQP